MQLKCLPMLMWSAFLFTSLMNASAQTNMFIDNSKAEQVLLGNFNPDDYLSSYQITDQSEILDGLVGHADRNHIAEMLLFLDSFYNRNTGSDTLSLHTGIGACRSWIKSYFDLISRENENRLVTGYLEFDANVCGTSHHKNPFAILPGRDTTLKEILVIEGHFDTRNENGCDTDGYTPGSDDNGSGTILVMEAARIMAAYTFDRTILFTTPTGEDQGLWGATAWANYLNDQGIEVMACLNNDVVGGIYCGKTSSPPSCPYEGHVDSTHVRIFSYVQGNSTYQNSPHKQLARLVKMIQEEQVNQLLETPMIINIMATEDRSGRSGDHIPFRRKGYPAIRFCSANEHGNGGGNFPDRQHSTRDVFGVDIDEDGILDTLYVDPGYLRRNLITNASVLCNLAYAAPHTDFTFVPRPGGVKINPVDPSEKISGYKVGIRYRKNRSHEFDEVQLHPAGEEILVDLPDSERYYVSIASIYKGNISRFSDEYAVNLTSSDPLDYQEGIRMEPISPNPWDTATTISIINSGSAVPASTQLVIQDITGRKVWSQQLEITPGDNRISIEGHEFAPGLYLVSLVAGGARSNSQKMIKQ